MRSQAKVLPPSFRKHLCVRQATERRGRGRRALREGQRPKIAPSLPAFRAWTSELGRFRLHLSTLPRTEHDGDSLRRQYRARHRCAMLRRRRSVRESSGPRPAVSTMTMCAANKLVVKARFILTCLRSADPRCLSSSNSLVVGVLPCCLVAGGARHWQPTKATKSTRCVGLPMLRWQGQG